MRDDLAPPPEALAFLVRTLAPRELWTWLGTGGREELRHRVALGFRATHEVLRQPAARSRLVAHLEKTPPDFQSLLQLWGASEPPVLAKIRALDEAALTAQLATLQATYGGESLLLALLLDDKAEVAELWATSIENVDVHDTANVQESSPLSLLEREIATLKKLCARETAKASHWREKCKEAQSRAATNEKTLRDKLTGQEKIARDATRQSKAENLRAANLEEKFLEADKARERAERRARSTQAESESAQQELKTLQRQLLRLQQINEELRSQLALAAQQRQDRTTEDRAEKQAQATQELRVEIKSRTASSFINNTDGNILRITDAIDRNDEAFVATLRSELKVLQKHDAATYKRLFKTLRAKGEYYTRILVNPTARVLVDASNVARYDAKKKGRLQYLSSLRNELRRHDFFPIIFVADASLPYFIDESQKLRSLIATGEVLVTASGQQADEVLAREARATGAYVVTNDRNFHFAFAPDFTPSRIGFRINEGVVILDEE
jgi:hypothetical protein